MSSPTGIRRIARLFCARGLLGFGVLLLCACAYDAGYRLPERFDSYGVEIFSNSSREPDLERPLHTALTRTLADHAGARLLRPSQADAVIRGRILADERRSGIRSPQNEWLESGKRLRVEAELLDRDSGEVLAEASTFVEVGFVFDAHGGEAEAERYALENTAQRLVLELLQQLNALEMETRAAQDSGAGESSH
ncbi:MAG: hypothetical protein KDB61_06935 [Planctomycetes bacterium]|nr:hypothetical protein [Planctomycetota bacterium]